MRQWGRHELGRHFARMVHVLSDPRVNLRWRVTVVGVNVASRQELTAETESARRCGWRIKGVGARGKYLHRQTLLFT